LPKYVDATEQNALSRRVSGLSSFWWFYYYF